MVKPIVNYRHPQDVWKWSSPNGRFFMGKTSIVKLKICQCMSAEIDRHWLNNSQPIQNTKKLPCRRGKKMGETSRSLATERTSPTASLHPMVISHGVGVMKHGVGLASGKSPNVAKWRHPMVIVVDDNWCSDPWITTIYSASASLLVIYGIFSFPTSFITIVEAISTNHSSA